MFPDVNTGAALVLDTLADAYLRAYGRPVRRWDCFSGRNLEAVAEGLNVLGGWIALTRRRGYPDVRRDLCRLALAWLESLGPPAFTEALVNEFASLLSNRLA